MGIENFSQKAEESLEREKEYAGRCVSVCIAVEKKLLSQYTRTDKSKKKRKQGKGSI